MQVDPIKPMLKPPGPKRLKLHCDILLSTFSFKFNLCRCTKVFQSFATKGGEEGCCPLCIRGFENQAGSYNRFPFSLTSAPSRATASGFTDKWACS
jgi:hypothetical protein